MSSPKNLPRLLYVANVPVESSYHGSALLYRLLQDYPADRLLVVESSLCPSQPARRLPGVRYAVLPTGAERLTRTRFATLYSSWHFLRAPFWSKQAAALLKSFQPEAVLTVAHAHLWLTAATVAKHRQLPLHLICHDEITNTVMHLPALRNRVNNTFGEAYRQASSRLCVSPYMRDDYRRRFGVDADVLYPSRAVTVPAFDEPPTRLASLPQGLRVAFAGTINSRGHMELLRQLAAVLETQGGKLLLYGPITAASAHSNGLCGTNVELRGMLPSHDLIKALRGEADVLYVPMSFAPEDRLAMKTNFPSKLTDYTAVGLPILIQGPADSSAVRWARENEAVAEVVDESTELVGSLQRLSQDSGWRLHLARQALLVGTRYFDAAVAKGAFYGALANSK